MNHQRVHRLIGLAVTLVVATCAHAGPAHCPQAVACEKAQAMFLQQARPEVLHRAQDLPPDLIAALAASTGSHVIANRPSSGNDLLPAASTRHAPRFDEHQFSVVSAELAAIVYRTRGAYSRDILLLFTRETEEPVCRLHLQRPASSPGDIRQALQQDFNGSAALYAGCESGSD